MYSQLECFSKMDHARNHSFILAIISRGSDVPPSSSSYNSAESFMEKGMFISSDFILAHYNVVLDYFIPLNCLSVCNKPKYIFFGCCWGWRGLPASRNLSTILYLSLIILQKYRYIQIIFWVLQLYLEIFHNPSLNLVQYFSNTSQKKFFKRLRYNRGIEYCFWEMLSYFLRFGIFSNSLIDKYASQTLQI